MGDPVRREGTPEQGADSEERVPEESGPRRRPARANAVLAGGALAGGALADGALADGVLADGVLADGVLADAVLASDEAVETELGDVTELVEVVPPPPRARMRVPPPPPRRSAPPPPRAPTPPAKNERFDLDALVLTVPPAPPLSSPSLSSPSIAPVRPRRTGPSWGVTLGIAASALVMGGGAAWMLVAREPERVSPTPAAVVPTVEDVRPAVAEAVEPERAVAPPAVEAPAAPAIQATSSEPATLEIAPEPRRVRGRIRRTWRTRRGQRREAPATEAATPEASSAGAASEPSAASAPAPDEAAEGASSEATASPTDGTLPERPSRADVEGAVARVLPDVRACAPGTGLASLHLHFAPSGRATTAQVESRLASPEQRSCMARAARGAEVPPFSGPRLSVRYPIQL